MNRILILLTLFMVTVSDLSFSEQTQEQKVPVLSVGDKVNSPTECYTIVKELGEGAFGKVYAVEDTSGQKFAMKSYKIHDGDVLSKHVLGDSQREFERGQLFDYPNIIKSIELFSHTLANHGESKYLILQLVEGQPLYKINKRTFSQQKAFKAAIEFCEAIDYARSLDYVHLDLHQGNVMLNDIGEVMIIDLASFFSYDELYKFVETQSQTGKKEPTQEKEQVAGGDGAQPQKLALAAAQEQGSRNDASIDAGKEERIKKFFKGHPHLFARMQKALIMHKKNLMRPQALRTDGSTPSPVEPDRTPMHAYYFNNISNICLRIIEKSDINREEKINLRAEIMKLAWSYSEDVEEGKVVPLEFYFDKLLIILKM